ERLPEGADVHARALEERRGSTVLLVEEREEQMLRLDEAVVVGEREALRVRERLLEAGGERVDAHGQSSKAVVRSSFLNWPLEAPVSSPPKGFFADTGKGLFRREPA